MQSKYQKVSSFLVNGFEVQNDQDDYYIIFLVSLSMLSMNFMAIPVQNIKFFNEPRL